MDSIRFFLTVDLDMVSDLADSDLDMGRSGRAIPSGAATGMAEAELAMDITAEVFRRTMVMERI